MEGNFLMATVKLTTDITLSMTVTNRAKSMAWFKEHFGFEELYSVDEIGWSEMSTNTPGVTLGLGDGIEQKPGNCTPVFGVVDIQAAVSGLKEKGVKFDGDINTIDGMVSLATFYDPDDNAFMLAQDLSEGS